MESEGLFVIDKTDQARIYPNSKKVFVRSQPIKSK
jgi:hypothetical protein